MFVITKTLESAVSSNIFCASYFFFYYSLIFSKEILRGAEGRERECLKETPTATRPSARKIIISVSLRRCQIIREFASIVIIHIVVILFAFPVFVAVRARVIIPIKLIVLTIRGGGGGREMNNRKSIVSTKVPTRVDVCLGEPINRSQTLTKVHNIRGFTTTNNE